MNTLRLWISAVAAALMVTAAAAWPASVSAQAAPIAVGRPVLTVYPLGTALVELPVGNPTGDAQEFRLLIVLLRADGSILATSATHVLKLDAGDSEWMSFNVPEADDARAVAVQAIEDPKAAFVSALADL
ncbi:MAG: hypothetical protein U0821_10655 [Chloroflexota bacterium]